MFKLWYIKLIEMCQRRLKVFELKVLKGLDTLELFLL